MNRNKVIKITEYQLREIVHNAIENYLNGENNVTDNPRIENGVPKFKNTIGNYKDTIYVKGKLTEGLIQTYLLDKVKNIVTRRFNLHPSQLQTEDMEEEGNTVTILTIILPSNASRVLLSEIKQVMNTCGYFAIGKFEIIPSDNRFGGLSFEPKFSKDISNEIREKCKFLYHSTSTTLIDKIRKNGLVPRSGNSLFMYPDRVYCMKGDVLTQGQKDVIKNVQYARNQTFPSLHNPSDTLEYSLLTIEVSKIPEGVKMYSDPMSTQAIFTYDNIPPTAIVNVEPFTIIQQ